VFLTDNGAEGGRYVCGLRGSKSSVYEGGVRSPLWLRWPGRLAPATAVQSIAAHIDVLPTLCDAAGVPLPDDLALDGRSLLPLLEGRAADWPDRHVVLQTHRGDVPQAEHHFAVIGERWKLVRHSGFGRAEAPAGHPFELYDLRLDPGEQRNLAAANPATVAALRDVYTAWFADVGSTRTDNWLPPRIRPGTPREPETTLTRQDWRPDDGEGWGHGGVWLLAFDEAQELDVTLLFREPTPIDRVTVRSGGAPRTLTVDANDVRVPLGAVRFAEGDVDLRIECRHGDALTAPYQVVLERR
jgi:arylsulfatase/arylsulfatase A